MSGEAWREEHARLLASLFSLNEFLRYLEGIEGADGLTTEIPHEPFLACIWEATGALERRGCIDASYFSRLIQTRPRRKVEIQQSEQAWAALGKSDADAVPDVASLRSQAADRRSALLDIGLDLL